MAPSAKWGCIFLHICHISMQFIFNFLTKNLHFSASDLPRVLEALLLLLLQLLQEFVDGLLNLHKKGVCCNFLILDSGDLRL